MPKETPKRNGKFVGGYVPRSVKDSLVRRAGIEFKTVSQVIREILQKEFTPKPAEKVKE